MTSIPLHPTRVVRVGYTESMNMARACLDILFPRKCPGCSTTTKYSLCKRCLSVLSRMQSARVSEKPILIDACAPYHHPLVRKIVRHLKNKRDHDLADLLAGHLYDHMAEELASWSTFMGTESILVIPVPACTQRSLRSAKYHNHADLLAQHFSRIDTSLFHYAPASLACVRTTQKQSLAHSKKTRLDARKGVFVAHNVSSQVCLVIDDVTTSGATFSEASRALFQAGARAVRCLSLAH